MVKPTMISRLKISEPTTTPIPDILACDGLGDSLQTANLRDFGKDYLTSYNYITLYNITQTFSAFQGLIRKFKSWDISVKSTQLWWVMKKAGWFWSWVSSKTIQPFVLRWGNVSSKTGEIQGIQAIPSVLHLIRCTGKSSWWTFQDRCTPGHKWWRPLQPAERAVWGCWGHPAVEISKHKTVVIIVFWVISTVGIIGG